MSEIEVLPGGRRPVYATEEAAACDLYARLGAPVRLAVGDTALIGTGIRLHLRPGRCALVLPRSGLALRHGITVLNAPGLIDPDFLGEVQVVLARPVPGSDGLPEVEIRDGDRIAQLMLVFNYGFTGAERMGIERGEGGFGSTGA